MRVISGRFRGKKLEWVSDTTTRPTTDRVKENIFNVLTSMGVIFEGSSVLVPFAGSGQMGIECHSRKAAKVVFNDTSPRAATVIRKNCMSVGLEPNILMLDYADCLKRLSTDTPHNQFDLVFLDPPFADTAAPVIAAKMLLQNKLLSKNAVIVAETETPNLEFPADFTVATKKYGRATIYFLTNN